jgi:rhamnose utilization protein RhaD (predicted bifunctional aldolase and dehydrogenase)
VLPYSEIRMIARHSELLNDLVTMSRQAGSDILLVQGAGGNTSVKSDDGKSMWIKASGLNLSEMTAEFGAIQLSLPPITSDRYFDQLAALPPEAAHVRAIETVQQAAIDPGLMRPSVETLFHVVLDKFVLHTHSVYANAFTCMVGGKKLVQQLDPECEWISYITPGHALGAEVRQRAIDFLKRHGRSLKRILLENHGPISTGATAAEAIAGTDHLVALSQSHFGAVPADALYVEPPNAILTEACETLYDALQRKQKYERLVSRASRLRILRQFANQPEVWLTPGPLIPDDIVYFGRTVYSVNTASEVAALVDRLPEAPGSLVVVIRDQGVVFAGPNARFVAAMEEGLAAHALTRWLISHRGQAQLMSADAIDTIVNMEAEKHRKAMLSR